MLQRPWATTSGGQRHVLAVPEFEGPVGSPQWSALLVRAENRRAWELAHMSAGGASYEQGVMRKTAKHSKQTPLI